LGRLERILEGPDLKDFILEEKKMSYARANLFVGKYQIPPSGQIKLSAQARVRYLRGTVTAEGWAEDANGKLWLIVEDGNFWSVMIELDDQDEQPPQRQSPPLF
jgi:hypothetical protein